MKKLSAVAILVMLALSIAPISRADVTLASATSSGVVAKITPMPADTGLNYVRTCVDYHGAVYCRTGPDNWAQLNGTIPVADQVVLLPGQEPFKVPVTDMDISALVGMKVYVAYGATEEEALNVPGHLALIYTVPEPSVTFVPTPTITPMGVRVIGANQLPVGCDSASQQCWRDALASGLVKLVATSATMTGYNNRAVMFAYYRNTSTAFGVTGLWNYLPLYADDLSLVGSDIFGGSSAEVDWVYGNAIGIIVHEKSTGLCYQDSWEPPPFFIWSNRLVSCPE